MKNKNSFDFADKLASPDRSCRSLECSHPFGIRFFTETFITMTSLASTVRNRDTDDEGDGVRGRDREGDGDGHEDKQDLRAMSRGACQSF